jgi:hypothetical protein
MMEAAFRRLERLVPPPIWQEVHGHGTWRYQEKTLHQAIIQKLARQISGLHAADALLLAGCVQEMYALQRILDEIGEDILFLSLAAMSETLSDKHRRYLSAFWAEEFDDPDPVKSTQKRATIPRKAIRSYIATAFPMSNPFAWHASSNTVHKTFSGYVHAASPQIMDMVGGSTERSPQFHVRGMLGTPRVNEGILSIWNYFLRGIMSLAMAAQAFEDQELANALYGAMEKFEKTNPGAA